MLYGKRYTTIHKTLNAIKSGAVWVAITNTITANHLNCNSFKIYKEFSFCSHILRQISNKKPMNRKLRVILIEIFVYIERVQRKCLHEKVVHMYCMQTNSTKEAKGESEQHR